MFGVEYQDCSKANISCDKYRYFFKDALNIAEAPFRLTFHTTCCYIYFEYYIERLYEFINILSGFNSFNHSDTSHILLMN